MADLTIITTQDAPGAVGPYSQGVRIGDLIFTAGQIPLDPTTGEMLGSGIEEQTHQVIRNLEAVLKAGGSSLSRVVKMSVFMVDLGQFQAMNAVYAEYFPEAPPARSAFQVAALPLGAAIEMECVAAV